MLTGDERVFFGVWRDLVQQSVNEEAYQAAEAGLHGSIIASSSHVQLVCCGYNDKLVDILSTYLDRIVSLKMSAQ